MKLCPTRMYNIVQKQDNLTQASIHLGLHDHPMVEGHLRKMFEQVKYLVKEEASCTPWAIMSTIAFATSKTSLLEHLMNMDGQEQVEVLKGDKLRQVMDKFLTLSFPNVWNLIVVKHM